MVRSTTPPRTDNDALGLDPAPASSDFCLAVAYSGGRDSTALLHATACMARELGGIQVLALHVHHGLSTYADDWLAHAQAQCKHWADEGLPVSLHWRHLQLAPVAGQSIEAVAREGRYQALSEMADSLGCDTVLLAHHRQDQAETFLLQAMRGAGVAGLSAMPQHVVRHGIQWVRPWLEHPSSAVAHYVAHHGLTHIEDDSNADARLLRNRLRLAVWPTMVQAFPQSEASLAQSATHQADVKACLDDWLSLKLPSLLRVDGHSSGVSLDVSAWRSFNDGQQRELLRAWFQQVTEHVLAASWVMRLHREVQAGAAHWPITLRNSEGKTLAGQVVLYRGLLSWHAMAIAVDTSATITLCLQHAGLFSVPQAAGSIQMEETQHEGVALHRLQACELRWRQGGEQFQLAPDRPARCLKKQYQAMGVPSCARQQPLLWVGDQLIFVPGLGIDARAWGNPSEVRVSLAWLPDVDRLK